MKRYIALISLVLAIGVLIGLAAGYLAFTIIDLTPKAPAPAPSVEKSVTELAISVAKYLRSGDFESLSRLVHPSYGLVFSPRMTVSLKNNRCLSALEVASMGSDSALYVWGTAEGSTVPLELTVQDYLSSYVNDRDYASAPLIGVNYAVKTGNSLDNTTELFPNGQFVELCYPGTGENDWTTLRLVFEEYEGELKLTAVIHGEYVV